MKMRWVWHFVVRLATAALLGGAFHAAWVALFIFAVSQGAPGVLRATLWLTAPVVTAAGFGLGLTLSRHHEPDPRTRFGRAFVAVLSGCAIGAVVMSPIGPMFVGLGVFGGGLVAAAVRVASDRPGRGQRAGVA
jgi:hypothetical protein